MPKIGPHSKIVVVGTSGAGKSTFALELSKKLKIPDIELDALFWEPEWTEAEPDVFRARVEKAITQEAWVVHGNYGSVRELIWQKADLIIWLDYSLPVVLWRVFKRSVFRIFDKTPVCNGNYENFRLTFLSKDSIILWSLQSYPVRKKNYSELIESPAYAHKMIRITKPQDLAKL